MEKVNINLKKKMCKEMTRCNEILLNTLKVNATASFERVRMDGYMHLFHQYSYKLIRCSN